MMISPICTKELVDYLGKLVTIVTIRQSVFFSLFFYDFSIKIANFVAKIQKLNERFAISCVCSQNKIKLTS